MTDFFNLTLSVFALVFTAYLVFLKVNPDRRNKVLNKYKKDISTHRLLQNIYSGRFLIAWVLLILSYVLDVVFRNATSQSITNLIFVVSMVLSIASLYLLFTVFFRKKSKN